jgi:hypothetical protein
VHCAFARLFWKSGGGAGRTYVSLCAGRAHPDGGDYSGSCSPGRRTTDQLLDNEEGPHPHGLPSSMKPIVLLVWRMDEWGSGLAGDSAANASTRVLLFLLSFFFYIHSFVRSFIHSFISSFLPYFLPSFHFFLPSLHSLFFSHSSSFSFLSIQLLNILISPPGKQYSRILSQFSTYIHAHSTAITRSTLQSFGNFQPNSSWDSNSRNTSH